MLGKAKCKILKEIRQKIADENDIPYVTRECTHQGDCSGTCPRCEGELRYLERELEKRAQLGRTVAVTALCTGIALSTSACSNPLEPEQLGGAPEEWHEEEELAGATAEDPEVEELMGDVAIDPDSYEEELAGAPEMWPEEENGQDADAVEETPEGAFDGLVSVASTFNTAAIYEGARSCPLYETPKDVNLKAVTTYHWNGGEGAVPGSIRIYDVTDGEEELLGTWKATARGGSGAQNVYWDIFPDITLQAGHTYHIIDSDAQTWSTNEAADYIGFVDLYTEEGAGEDLAGTFSPCGSCAHTEDESCSTE